MDVTTLMHAGRS